MKNCHGMYLFLKIFYQSLTNYCFVDALESIQHEYEQFEVNMDEKD